jgi:tRNA threonylcarbamoyladenosine biosynthesis protein TsaE
MSEHDAAPDGGAPVADGVPVAPGDEIVAPGDEGVANETGGGLDELIGVHEIATPEDMTAFGERIGALLRAGDLLVLTGPLGAGKTTLARGIGAGMRVRGPVTSPTFVLARTHPSLASGPALVHVDAYRLASALELDDLDLEFEHSAVVVEWGRGMVDALRDTWWDIELEQQWNGRGVDTACGEQGRGGDLDDDVPRTVTVTRHPAASA